MNVKVYDFTACWCPIIFSLVDSPVGPSDLSIQDVFVFFTSSDVIPPLGFTPRPSLYFHEFIEYPFASTCALSLTLPKEKMVNGFKNHGGIWLKYEYYHL